LFKFCLVTVVDRTKLTTVLATVDICSINLAMQFITLSIHLSVYSSV